MNNKCFCTINIVQVHYFLKSQSYLVLYFPDSIKELFSARIAVSKFSVKQLGCV